MKRSELAADLARVIAEVCDGELDSAGAAARLRSIADKCGGPQLSLVDQATGSAMVEPPSTVDQDVEEVFAYWKRVTGKAKAVLLPKRRAKIRARLRRYSVTKLKLAIDGAMTNEFLVEGNHTDIASLFADDIRVERHIEAAGESVAHVHHEPAAMTPEVEHLKGLISDARGRGDVDEYNRLNQELRVLLAKESR